MYACQGQGVTSEECWETRIRRLEIKKHSYCSAAPAAAMERLEEISYFEKTPQIFLFDHSQLQRVNTTQYVVIENACKLVIKLADI